MLEPGWGGKEARLGCFSGASADPGLADSCPGGSPPSSPVTVAARVVEAPSPSRAVRPCTAGDRRLYSRGDSSGGVQWLVLAGTQPSACGVGWLAGSLALSVLPRVSLLSAEAYSCRPPSPRRGHRTRRALLQDNLLPIGIRLPP